MKIPRFLLPFIFLLFAPLALAQTVYTDAFSQAGLHVLTNETATTEGATMEVGETLGQVVGAQSVWARVGNVPDGPLRVEVVDPNFLIVTVYRGASMDTLTVLSSADNVRNGKAELAFDYTSAEPHYIQVVTVGTPTPAADVELLPANDLFAHAREVTWSTQSPTLTNRNAIAEFGEPNVNAGQGRSVWFRWVVPRTARYFISSGQATFARAVDIFTGDVLQTLTRIGGHLITDNDPNTGTFISARAGQIFRVRVQRHSGQFAAEGDFGLTFVPQAPANDAFANRFQLQGTLPIASLSSPATFEPGEPAGNDGLTLAGSLWYFWDAPATGTATFDTTGSESDTVLRLYRGPANVGVTLADLVLAGSNDDVVAGVFQSVATIPVQQGERIYAQIGTKPGAFQDGVLQVRSSVQAQQTTTTTRSSVHFTNSHVLWDGGATPYSVGLERVGGVTLPLTVNVRWTRFDGSQIDRVASFAANEALASIQGTAEFLGPFGGALRTTYELLPGAEYDLGVPDFCEVLVEPSAPFVPATANFSGLIESGQFAALGTIKLDTTATGAYTLRLKIAGVAFTLKGQLDARGRITRVVNLPGLGRQVLDLRLNTLLPVVTGTFGDASVYAGRKISRAMSDSLGLTNRKLVFVFSPDGSGPQGTTYATGTIGVGGEVRLVGELPDARPFTIATQLAADLTIPVSASLYGGRGALHGFFLRRSAPTPAWTAEARWIKPANGSGELGAAIDQSLSGYGETYTPPAPGAPLSAGFADTATLRVGLGGGQVRDLTFSLGVGPTATFSSGAEFGPALRVTRSTGFFRGSIKASSTAPSRTFRGVFVPGLVFQGIAGRGAGLLIDGTNSRSIELLPIP